MADSIQLVDANTIRVTEPEVKVSVVKLRDLRARRQQLVAQRDQLISDFNAARTQLTKRIDRIKAQIDAAVALGVVDGNS